MVENIVSKSRSILKNDSTYKSAHESLCAKLQQAQTIADIVATSDLTDGQMNRLAWCLADMLKAASTQCENLTPQDFKSGE